jgi:hypothetical protein
MFTGVRRVSYGMVITKRGRYGKNGRMKMGSSAIVVLAFQ